MAFGFRGIQLIANKQNKIWERPLNLRPLEEHVIKFMWHKTFSIQGNLSSTAEQWIGHNFELL